LTNISETYQVKEQENCRGHFKEAIFSVEVICLNRWSWYQSSVSWQKVSHL